MSKGDGKCQVTVFRKVVRMGLTEKTPFEQRTEGREELNMLIYRGRTLHAREQPVQKSSRQGCAWQVEEQVMRLTPTCKAALFTIAKRF